MKKVVVRLLLILCIVSCVLSVSASVYTIGPGDSIQSAVNKASSGDTIVLNPGMYSENGITIAGKSLTLRAAYGHGSSDTIIDGKSAAPRIFTVTDTSSLIIENLALQNGRAKNGANGGDSFWDDGGDGSPGDNGGAISSRGPVKLISSTITGCSAGRGGNGGSGGIYWADGGDGADGGNGGAIYTTSSVTLTTTTINGCSAGNGGNGGDDGGVGSRGTVGHGGHGGAIYSESNVTLTTSTITDCSAGNGGSPAVTRTGGTGGNGGAIAATTGTVTLTSSSISRSSAGKGGTSDFQNSDGGPGGNGGAISTGGPVMIASSTITQCSAGNGANGQSSGDGSTSGNGGKGGNGGAIAAMGNVGITTSTITDCSAGNGGKGSNSNFLFTDGGHGRPGGDGGAVYATSAVGIISSTITNCKAGTGGTGGSAGLWGDRGHKGSDGNGGAIYAQSGVLHFCRLTNDNTPGKAVYSSGGSIDATNNWWGSNNNPSALVGGQTTSSPWLVLGIKASPISINTEQTAVVEANLTYDSAGIYHNPAGPKIPLPFPTSILAPLVHVPDGIPVSYTVLSGMGSVRPGSTVIKSGRSQTQFNPSYLAGTAKVTATVDGQTVSAIIDISGRPAPPVVTGISPTSGPSSGGTMVTITGTGFKEATMVLFGPIGGPRGVFSVMSDTTITATSPRGLTGTVDVIVITPYGSSQIVTADRFTFLPPPTTVPTPVPTTVPIIRDIVGCWEMSHYDGDTRIAYTYNLQPDGIGWMNGTRTTSTASESYSDRIRWTMDPTSAVVTIVEADPREDGEPSRWVLTYDGKDDVLDGGVKGQVALIFRRMPCYPVG